MKSQQVVSRRRFLYATGGMALGLAALAGCAPQATPAPTQQPPAQPASTQQAPAQQAPQVSGQLSYLSWEGYDDPEAAKPFYDRTGVQLNSTYITSNDDILTKYRAGGAGRYDVGAINNRYFAPMIAQNMIIPLDIDRIPNAADLFPQFKDPAIVPWAYKDGKIYGIPAYFGFAPICYNADRVKKPFKSWDELLEPDLKGRVGLYDNGIGTILLVGINLGFGPDGSTYTKAQLGQITDWLKQLKGNVKTIIKSYGEMTDLLIRGDIDVAMEGWEVVTVRGKKAGANLAHVYPDGPLKSWCDAYFIFNGAQNVDAAYAWINHMVSAEAMAISGPNLSSLVTNAKSIPLLPKEFVTDMGMDAVDQRLGRAAWTVLPNATETDPNKVTIADMNKAWEEIKAL